VGNVSTIINTKYKNGTLSSMELSRQKMVLLSQQSSILSLKTQKDEQLRALALLCGEVPQNFSIKEESIESIKNINLSTPLSSTLLLHRPDIASSFEQLKIAEASIDSANASKFPSFSLNANGGLASSTLLFLTNPTSSIGAIFGIDYALFDGGKLDKEIKVEESKAKIAVQNYEKSLITALKEVEDGLSSVERERQEAILQKEMLKEAQKTFNLSNIRYKEGTIELQILLEAQKTLFEAKQNVATQKLAQLNALITLVKVLGGGWSRGY
jgi:outer membrane protein TolC